jgi:hypothetical protein
MVDERWTQQPATMKEHLYQTAMTQICQPKQEWNLEGGICWMRVSEFAIVF